MTKEEMDELAHSFAGVTYQQQWRGSHVWKVAGKVFVIGVVQDGGDMAYTFKTSWQNFHFLLESEGYRPAPYLASRGMSWIQCTQSSAALDEALRYYVEQSYQLVTEKLPKKQQRALGLIA